jgi:hypothetical protein
VPNRRNLTPDTALKEEMRLRLAFSLIVLLALAANQPCIAKAAHGRHGSNAGVANSSAKAKAANPAESKAKGAISTQPTIPPPVLPPQGATQRQSRVINPIIKIAPPANAPRGQTAETTRPMVRNAIGQPMVQSKTLAVAQPHLPPTLQTPSLVPPILRGTLPAQRPAVSSDFTRANAPTATVANAANRGSVNGAALIRPAAAPTGIGGAVRPKYGINGTTVVSKH